MSLAYVALWIFVFTLPSELVIVAVPGMGAVSKVTGMAALGAAVLAAVISARVRRLSGFHIAALLFVLCAAAGELFLHAHENVPRKLYTYVQLLLAVWIIWELAPSRRRVHGLMMAYVLGAYVAVFDTILVYRREASVLRRFAVEGADANDLAMTLALALPMAWYLGMTYRQPLLRWVCRAYLPIGLFAIGLTGSRGGMLASMVALLIVPLSMTLSPGRLMTAIATLALTGSLAVAYIPQKVVQRLATTGTEVEDLRLGGRFKLWVAGIHALGQKPFMGYGTARYKMAITPELGSAAQVAHNSFMSVLVEQGIIGFFLYGMMFFAVFRAILTLPRAERRFALILFATLGVTMLPLTWEDRRAAWFVLAALLGLAHSRAVETVGAVSRARVPGAAPVARPVTARPLVAPNRREVDRDAPA
jgi:O-antigen ligase